MVFRSGDTIAAIATPQGEGAIAVIRVSGSRSLTLVDGIFRGTSSLSSSQGFRAHSGLIVGADGSPLDQVIVTVFRSPRSYTGEDSVEISCHGGALIGELVLERVIDAGARPAAPGEFTRRAFQNGKMDLTQAEAVADLIAAKSERARRVSMEQLEGRLGNEARQLRRELVSLCSLLELGLDFAEEGIELLSNENIKYRTQNALDSVARLIGSYKTGKVLREGVSVAITGEPNVGKSSIFNALLEHDRAIVTHVPGTTRDTLEESIVLSGLLFRLTDTAGIRHSDDPAESEGITRARIARERADIVLQVTDITRSPAPSAEPGAIVVRNKADLLPASDIHATDSCGIVVSARTGEGLETLRQELVRRAISGSADSHEGTMVTRQRHREILARAEQLLKSAVSSVSQGIPGEFVALDIRSAANALGELTGEVTTEEILDSIFSSFCIGK